MVNNKKKIPQVHLHLAHIRMAWDDTSTLFFRQSYLAEHHSYIHAPKVVLIYHKKAA